jgi:hypothetical protein
MTGEERRKAIIVYGTCYGTAKRYADELAERAGIPCVSYEDAGDLAAYDDIVYIGALYAGGVLGMKATLGALQNWEGKRISIATVGLADTTDEENIRNIRAGMVRQLPAGMMERAKLVHLRGGIDYSALNVKHKFMMKLLCEKAKKLPPEKQTAEVRAMIDTYGQVVDFVDRVRVSELM